jgi:hypothetical protein
METSLTANAKPSHKVSQVLPTNYHLKERQYVGHVQIGGENFYTPEFDSKEEALLELRCLEKQTGFELIKTTQDEGYYPERAMMIEDKYRKSGRTNGLYSGLSMDDGTVSQHGS